jgi:hypothetical protein
MNNLHGYTYTKCLLQLQAGAGLPTEAYRYSVIEAGKTEQDRTTQEAISSTSSRDIPPNAYRGTTHSLLVA